MFIKVTSIKDKKKLINLNTVSEILEEDDESVFVLRDDSRFRVKESFLEIEIMIRELQKR